jgi:casein kinase 1, epsilon
MQFGGKFELGERIGGGSFGEIFHVKNVRTCMNLAAKVEVRDNTRKSSSQIRREAKIYSLLRGNGRLSSLFFVFFYERRGV